MKHTAASSDMPEQAPAPEGPSAVEAPAAAGFREKFLERFQLNPMMYKGLTQGVRSRGFLAMFFCLLLCGLLTTLLGAASGERNGAMTFGFLLIELHLYGTIIGVQSLLLASREMENKTFELYTLAGMSPEKMTRGSLMTLWYSFFFGLSCMAPFMFSSYFMGGLDFRSIAAALFLLSVAHVSYHAVCVLAALGRGMTKSKTLTMGAYVLGSLFFGFMGMMSIGAVVFDPSELSNLTSDMMGAGALDWMGLGLPCLLAYGGMFYCCCQLLCPETDSREHILRAFATLAWAVLLVFMVWEGLPPYHREGDFLGFVSLQWGFWLVFGLFFWINRDDPPIIVRNDMRGAGWFRRALFFFFEPGRRGAARNMLLMWAASASTLLGLRVFFGHWTPGVSNEQILVAAWLPAAGLAFLAVGDRLARSFGPLAKNNGARRGALGAFWALVAMVVFFGAAFSSNGNVDIERDPAVHLAGMVATPALTPFVAMHPRVLGGTALLALMGLHVLVALGGLWLDSRRIKRRRSHAEPIGSDVAAPAPGSMPEVAPS